MSNSDAGYPAEPYKYRNDAPHVAPNRPLSQGDVFRDIPLVGGAVPDARHEGVWKPKSRKGLGLFITHPCASRSSTTYRLHEYVSVAPVVKRPRGFEPPWDGYYDLCPLPGLRNGEDYVAKLNEACPVPTAALEGQRIAVLTVEGLVALFHRLAMNSLRFPETPTHYKIEAAKVTHEIDLWERWITKCRTGDGFQEWLNQPFGGQPREDVSGNVIPGSAEPPGEPRRAVLAWNYKELCDELDATPC
jgi:hypothetical protein